MAPSFSNRRLYELPPRGLGLPTLSAENAIAMVDITGTVVASRLHEWASGRCSIDDVNESVQRTVDMVFTFPVSLGT